MWFSVVELVVLVVVLLVEFVVVDDDEVAVAECDGESRLRKQK